MTDGGQEQRVSVPDRTFLMEAEVIERTVATDRERT